jgi:hypothetical protein
MTAFESRIDINGRLAIVSMLTTVIGIANLHFGFPEVSFQP